LHLLSDKDPLIPLVPRIPFETDSKLEPITKQYAGACNRMYVEIVDGAGKQGSAYKDAYALAIAIEKEHVDELRKYLAPYMGLGSHQITSTEHHRWYAAVCIMSPVSEHTYR